MKAKLLQKMYKAVTRFAISEDTHQDDSNSVIEILSRGQYENNIDTYQIHHYRKFQATLPQKTDRKKYLSSSRNIKLLKSLDKRLISKGEQDVNVFITKQANIQKQEGDANHSNTTKPNYKAAEIIQLSSDDDQECCISKVTQKQYRSRTKIFEKLQFKKIRSKKQNMVFLNLILNLLMVSGILAACRPPVIIPTGENPKALNKIITGVDNFKWNLRNSIEKGVQETLQKSFGINYSKSQDEANTFRNQIQNNITGNTSITQPSSSIISNNNVKKRCKSLSTSFVVPSPISYDRNQNNDTNDYVQITPSEINVPSLPANQNQIHTFQDPQNLNNAIFQPIIQPNISFSAIRDQTVPLISGSSLLQQNKNLTTSSQFLQPVPNNIADPVQIQTYSIPPSQAPISTPVTDINNILPEPQPLQMSSICSNETNPPIPSAQTNVITSQDITIQSTSPIPAQTSSLDNQSAYSTPIQCSYSMNPVEIQPLSLLTLQPNTTNQSQTSQAQVQNSSISQTILGNIEILPAPNPVPQPADGPINISWANNIQDTNNNNNMTTLQGSFVISS